jgi:lipid II:glycine glycyltransferase (peptidoglycan interpeptide bridge formation enzyme)
MVQLLPKETEELQPTDILFQTPYWAQVKSSLGLTPQAYDVFSSGPWGDVLVLLKTVGDHKVALVPQGPEVAPQADDYGTFLENLSLSLSECLPPDLAFIRYDLPWKSLYADEMQEQGWNAFPEPRLREMRMNIGTQHWNFRKSFEDMTVASSLVVDINRSEDAIMAGMKPKTRYNIRLAQRKGVTVQQGSLENLRDFHNLYCQTAQRNGFSSCDLEHFSAMFRCRLSAPGHSELLFLIARHGTDILAGAIIGISGTAANFLYGASANIKRNLMASSLMHWEGIRRSRSLGCTTYEMGAVPPGHDPAHPFHGLYRFKTGFGGTIELRSGTWDYPVNENAYRNICNAESLYREH